MDRTARTTIVLAVCLLSGCLPYERPTTAFANARYPDASPEDREIRAKAASSPLYRVIPRDRRQIAWYDAPHWITWALFGNELNGIFGEDVNPPYSRSSDMNAFFAWQLRNPFTNFCYYVIGSADWETHHSFSLIRADATGPHLFKSEEHPSVFGQGKSAFILAFNDFKPYISFKFPVSKTHGADFYFGWRPEGHFGIKCRPYVETKK